MPQAHQIDGAGISAQPYDLSSSLEAYTRAGSEVFSEVVNSLVSYFSQAAEPEALSLLTQAAPILIQNWTHSKHSEQTPESSGQAHSLLLSLRATHPALKNAIEHSEHARFSAFSNSKNFQFQANHFFNGPGLSLKKLYRSLPSHDQVIVHEMFNHIAPEQLSTLFSSQHFEKPDNRAMLQDEKRLPLIQDIEARVQTFDTQPSSLHNNKLQWIKFKCKTSGAEVALLGQFDRSKAEPFLGIAYLKFKDSKCGVTLPSRYSSSQYFVPVVGKTLHSDSRFDFKFLLANTRGTMVRQINGRTHKTIGIQFGPSAAPVSGQRVDQELHIPNRETRHWRNVVIQDNLQLLPGTSGSKEIVYSDGKTKRWHDCVFDSNGHAIPGTAGNVEVISENQETHRWQGVTFLEKGSIMPGSKGNKELHTPKGETHRWIGAEFDSAGLLSAESKIEKVIEHADGSISRWSGATVQTNFSFKAGSKGNKSIEYPDGTHFKWKNVRFTETGEVIPRDKQQKEFVLPGAGIFHSKTIHKKDVNKDKS